MSAPAIDLKNLDYAEVRKHMTPAELAEIDKLLARDKRIFFPNPGPQFAAFKSEADIIGYGGAAGGGKSYLICGLALTEHKRSVVFRQHKNQTRKFVQDFTKLIGNSDGYSSQNSEWKYDGRLIEFGGLEDPNDYEKWQGRDHDLKCVGAGTPIWMADGSSRAIEDIATGDMVATLEGPRRVSRTLSFRKPAVLLQTRYGSQVQSSDHQILTPRGWTSCDDLRCRSGVSSPTSRRASRTAAGWFGRSCSRLASSTAALCAGLGRLAAPASEPQAPLPTARWSATTAHRARRVQGSAPAVCCASSPAIEQRLSRIVSLAAERQLQSHREESAAERATPPSGAVDALVASSLQDWSERCSSDNYLCGEQLRPYAADDLLYPQRLDDAEPQTPTCWLVDAPQHIHGYTLPEWSWVHPYTKETRRTAYQRRDVVLDYCDVGEQTLYDLTVEGANHYISVAGFVNRNCYDEVTQMREYDVRYTAGWNRTDDPKQRCRTLFTFNPPTTPEGRWVIRYFAPWLDRAHPNPAQDGELRWFTTVGDNQDYECESNRPFVIEPDENGVLAPNYDFDPGDYLDRPELMVIPKSRTFITARAKDNPYYVNTGYIQQLQMLPEPLRSQMLHGDFMAGVEDDANQLIPTPWVEAAQARWLTATSNPAFTKGPMVGLGVDAARGGNMGGTTGATGKDKMVISPRHEAPALRFFDTQIALKGVDVNTGNLAAAQIVQHRRHGAPVQLDVASIGTSVFDSLTDQGIHVVALNNAAASPGRDKSSLLKFSNRRAEFHWRMREALDPEAQCPCAIPPDPELLADLTAPRFSVRSTGIVVEPKADIKKRIGRSPDKGEALMYANVETYKRDPMTGNWQGIPEHARQQLAAMQGGDYDSRRLEEIR